MFNHKKVLKKASAFTLMMLLCINFNSTAVKASTSGAGGGGKDDENIRKLKESLMARMKAAKAKGVPAKVEAIEEKAPAKTAPHAPPAKAPEKAPAPVLVPTVSQQCERAFTSFINGGVHVSGLHPNHHVNDHLVPTGRRAGRTTSYFTVAENLYGLRANLTAPTIRCNFIMGAARATLMGAGGECHMECTHPTNGNPVNIGRDATTRGNTHRLTVRYLLSGGTPLINTMFPSENF